MGESKHTPLRVRDANASAGEIGTTTNPAAFVVEDSCGDVRAIVTLSAVETRSGEGAKRYALECAAASACPEVPPMIDTLTHAYTVRQPFAHATAVGWKPIENKTERPPLALIGQLVGIHAGLQWARPEDMPYWPTHLYPMPAPDDPRLTYGALIGVARLVGVVSLGNPLKAGCLRFWRHVGRSKCVGEYVSDELAARIRPWWRGPWGWLLDEAVLLPEPIPMRGQQGLWRINSNWLGATEAAPMCASAQWALEQWRKARETR